MKSYRLNSFGLDGLRLEESIPAEPGPGQIGVAIKAVSLNYRDLLMVTGLYDKNLAMPMTPCSDGAGEVIAVGPGVTQHKIGDRVVGGFMQGWVSGPYDREKSKTALGGALPGTLATQVIWEANASVPIPEYMTFEEAATLPCAAVTAWNALFEDRPIRPGETVLVQGTGGVSIFALQLAHAAGAKVIVTSSSDEKLARAKALGAWETINYRSVPQWGADARRMTGGGVDCVVEVGGAGTLKQSLDAVRFEGRINLIGVLSGAVGEIPTTMILHKAAHLRGIYVGSVEMLRSLVMALETNSIRPQIGSKFDFEHVHEAMQLMESAGHFGKIVISVP